MICSLVGVVVVADQLKNENFSILFFKKKLLLGGSVLALKSVRLRLV